MYYTTESMKTLVHAFVTSHLDYCNSVLAGAPRSATDKFQRVLNAAARLVSGTRKFDCGLSRLLHVGLALAGRSRTCAVQARRNSAPVSATQGPAVPDCVTPASDIASRQLCQSSPSSRAALPTQLTWLSVLRCRWINDLEFAVS